MQELIYVNGDKHMQSTVPFYAEILCYAEIPFRRRPGAGWNTEGAAEAIEAAAAPYGVCSRVRLSP